MPSGGFYLQGWFVQSYNTPSQTEWLLPLDGDFQHQRSTANVEELWVNPEDMDIPPEEIQVGPIQFITFSPPQEGFYVQATGPFGFYVQQTGPFGFYVQAIGI